MARRHTLIGRVLVVAAVLAVAAAAFWAAGGVDAIRRTWYPLAYQDSIAAQADTSRLDPYLVAALINAESGFDPEVVSSAGAVGLMQVKPSTSRSIARIQGLSELPGKKALTDPATNIRMGTLYLRYLMDRYGDDVALALAAYNAGLGNADRWAAEAKRSGRGFTDAIAFPETARYVDKVMREREVYRVLYPDAFGSPGK